MLGSWYGLHRRPIAASFGHLQLTTKCLGTKGPADAQALASGATPSLGAHAARLDSLHSADASGAGSPDTARTLFAWKDPVSPNVATQTEGKQPEQEV
jgi:hypothetical protein